MIEGELRWRLIMFSSCAMPSAFELIILVSHIIITPSRSQASTHSGVGMLCDVRTAFDPMPFRAFMR